MYKIYQSLLDKHGLKNADISRATGISNMTLSDWKRGVSTPKQDKLKKIADYFGVSLEYLTTGKEKEGEKYYLNEETAELAQMLFENRDLRILCDAAKDAKPEDIRTTYDMLMALKRKERGEDV